MNNIAVAPDTNQGFFMKKLFIFSILLVVSLTAINAQDVLTLKTGEDLNVKVIKITDNDIEYKKWNNLEGPTYTKHLYEVFSVKYQNGEKDVFNVPEPKANNGFNGQNNGNAYNMNTINNGRFRPGAHMIREKGNLVIDGIELTEGDASSMFDINTYNAYKVGRYRYASGKALVVCGWVSMGVAASAFATLMILGADGWVSIPCAGVFVGGATLLPFGYVAKGRGRRALDEIANTYNRQSFSENFSVSVNPSLMTMRLPDGSSQHGLGAALTLSF